VRATGVSIHPYQLSTTPNAKDPGAGGDNGIGNLRPFTDRSRELCDPDGQGACQGALKGPAGKLPGLYLTEFGYLNAPRHFYTTKDVEPHTQEALIEKNLYWHTENTIADWYLGNLGTSLGALDRAQEAGAKWMLLYNPVEFPPEPRPVGGDNTKRAKNAWETGLFGFASDSTSDVPKVTGARPWGKKGEKKPDYRIYLYPQQRRAFCAIRQWSIDRKIIDPVASPSLKDECPAPRSAHSGP
jgi:hypothetical protein